MIRFVRRDEKVQFCPVFHLDDRDCQKQQRYVEEGNNTVHEQPVSFEVVVFRRVLPAFCHFNIVFESRILLGLGQRGIRGLPLRPHSSSPPCIVGAFFCGV